MDAVYSKQHILTQQDRNSRTLTQHEPTTLTDGKAGIHRRCLHIQIRKPRSRRGAATVEIAELRSRRLVAPSQGQNGPRLLHGHFVEELEVRAQVGDAARDAAAQVTGGGARVHPPVVDQRGVAPVATSADLTTVPPWREEDCVSGRRSVWRCRDDTRHGVSAHWT